MLNYKVQRQTETPCFVKVMLGWLSLNLEGGFMRIFEPKCSASQTRWQPSTTHSPPPLQLKQRRLIRSWWFLWSRKLHKMNAGSTTDMTELEKISKGVQDVLAISRQARQGQASRATRNRGSGGGNFSNYKCYNCNQMGHLR